MTDVLVLVPYSRFLEVRARRLRVADELARAAPARPTDAPVASGPPPNDEGACAVERVLPGTLVPGVQPR